MYRKTPTDFSANRSCAIIPLQSFSLQRVYPYDGVALGVFAVDVLVAFRGIESLGNIRRFCSALNPQIVVYGLQSLFNDFRGYRLSVG